ncbi:MAG: uroporphyrinogen-III synthase [Micavibrio sp.]|nr:uroporphyrinogen-III synthase [Micavibrio sp.]
MQNYILITRPYPEAETLARDLREEGIESIISPVLAYQNLDQPYQKSDDFKGIVFTSAAGVRAFAQNADFIHLKCFCVGASTAEAAHMVGYTDIVEGDKGAGRLAGMIEESALDSCASLLYVHGADLAHDLVREFKGSKNKLIGLPVYKAIAASALSMQAVEVIKANEVRGVLLYSKRSADIFMRLIEDHALSDCLDSMKVLCISQSVVECVRIGNWKDILVSDVPSRTSMVMVAKTL